ncbi:MAG: CDP-glycerol glycerophosphotransferase family protein [Anaerovoracaceae bacterium]
MTKTKDKITIISRQDDKPSIDIKLISNGLLSAKDSPIVNVMTKTIPKNLLGKIKYLFYLMGPMMHSIASSKIVIVDGYCIPISILNHKNDLIVIQMWHAMGALKKFGYSILDQEEGSSSNIAYSMNMHKGYDYIFSSSKECNKYLAEAYGYEEDFFVTMPLPRVDILLDAPQPRKSNKETILYSPTFRKDDKDLEGVYEFINAIDYSKYNLIVRPHPLMEGLIITDKARVVEDVSSLELITEVDYIVTDYSAFVFEAAISGKPIFLYIPDIEKYKDNRGFYIDLIEEEFCYCSKSPFDVFEAITNKKFDLDKIKKFASKYVEICHNNTSKIVDFILEKRG